MNILTGVVSEIWYLLNASSLYLLIGFVIAGFIFVFISSDNVIKYFGKGKIKSVFMASVIGIPLPLCSCGVIPAAAALRKKGANKGATVSFLISTPESGVTSIAITYALMDIFMTIARPIASFITAMVAGMLENIVGREKNEDMKIDNSCEIDKCCDGIDCPPEKHKRHHTFYEKLIYGMKYSFGELLGDIASWLFIGFILAGIISYFVPSSLVSNYLGGGIIPKLTMLIIGVPLYICASASTPIAAALILKGMSPGTALVFLMAGPATNIASASVLTKIIGKRSTIIYLASICICSLILGYLLDYFYITFNITPSARIGDLHGDQMSFIENISTFIIIFLIGRVFFKKIISRKNAKSTCKCSGD